MNESSLPPAGWYPAPHAGGQSRYWDGAAWVESDAPGAPGAVSAAGVAGVAGGGAAGTAGTAGTAGAAGAAGAASGEQKRPSFLRRPMARSTGLIVAGSALLVGLLLGGGAGGAGAQSRVTSLSEQVASLETDVDDARLVAAENDTALADAQADLDAALDKLATATAALETVTAQVSEMQTAATASQGELDARAARITDLEGQLSAQTVEAAAPAAPVAAAPAAPSAPSSVYYKNCAAARAAGAAPVYSSDPGYGRHLDRDGDGVGCE